MFTFYRLVKFYGTAPTVSQIPSLTRQMAAIKLEYFFPFENLRKLQITVSYAFAAAAAAANLILLVKHQQPPRDGGRQELVLSGAEERSGGQIDPGIVENAPEGSNLGRGRLVLVAYINKFLRFRLET